MMARACSLDLRERVVVAHRGERRCGRWRHASAWCRRRSGSGPDGWPRPARRHLIGGTGSLPEIGPRILRYERRSSPKSAGYS